jgi:uncharacterized membrane protein YeaQ/YmgE (transglycosylase-associated protein family)
MTLFDVLILAIIAAICGSIGMAIGGYSRGGCLMSIAMGFVGAVIGMWLARALALPDFLTLQIGEVPFPIVYSIIGSALFVAVLNLLSRTASR